MATSIRLAAERGIVRPLVRSSRAPVPGLDHLPVDEDLATSDLGRSLMVIRGTPLSIGRPFAVRPGTPAERVAMLRESIARTIADPKPESPRTSPAAVLAAAIPPNSQT